MPSTVTQEETLAFLTQSLAKVLKVQPQDIDAKIPFERFGLDSAGAFQMTGEINKHYKLDLEPTILYDNPTIQQLATFVHSQMSR